MAEETSSRRPAVPLDDDPKASLPSACALRPWQSSRCSTWRRCCITADSSALADALSLVNPTNFVFDILLLGAFRHFVLLRNPLKELPPRALPENVHHSLGEIALKRVDVKDSKPQERTVLDDAVEQWCPPLSTTVKPCRRSPSQPWRKMSCSAEASELAVDQVKIATAASVAKRVSQHRKDHHEVRHCNVTCGATC